MVKIRQFLPGFLLLIFGILIFLIGYSRVGTVLILLSFLILFSKIYELNKGIKIYSKRWVDLYFIIIFVGFILSILIQHKLFNRQISFLEIILGSILLLALYLVSRFASLNLEKKKLKITASFLGGYCLIVIGLVFTILFFVFKNPYLIFNFISISFIIVGAILIFLNYLRKK